jgi:hypothetical protein
MKKILFTNIGNRHLYKDKKETGDYLYNEKQEFKKRTLEILEKWDQEKGHVHLNILSQYLDAQEEKPDIVVLFATNQDIEGKDKQDTLYAAQIIKRILEEQYHIPEVIIKEITVNPTNENELFPVYKKILNSLDRKYPDSQWIYLDAGGTPQQKLASKLLMPEIHPLTKVDYLENVEGLNKLDLINKELTALKEFFVLKNIKSLIEKGHYSSAIQLLRDEKIKNKAFEWIKIGKYRMLNSYKEIPINAGKLQDHEKEVAEQYLKEKPVICMDELRDHMLDKRDFFIYGEFLARAKYFLELQNWNNFILNFQQSLEVLLASLLLNFAKEDGIDLKGRTNNNKIEKFLKEYRNEEYVSIPTQLKNAIEISKEKDLNEVTEILNKYGEINASYRLYYMDKKNIKGLDSLRNDLVHKGKGIEKKDIRGNRNIISNFEQITDKLNLQNHLFTKLNKIINNKLFN